MQATHAYLHADWESTLQDKDNGTTVFDATHLLVDQSQNPPGQQDKPVGMCQLSGTVQDCCKLRKIRSTSSLFVLSTLAQR